MIFGLFKSKKQRAMEMFNRISEDTIRDALKERGIEIGECDDVNDFCVKSAKSIARIIFNHLGIESGKASKDDIFTAGLFVLGAGNYVTHMMGGNFEIASGAGVLMFYDEEEVDNSGDLTAETLDVYNSMMGKNREGVLLMSTIAIFFEKSGKQHLDDLIGFYKLVRDGSA